MQRRSQSGSARRAAEAEAGVVKKISEGSPFFPALPEGKSRVVPARRRRAPGPVRAHDSNSCGAEGGAEEEEEPGRSVIRHPCIQVSSRARERAVHAMLPLEQNWLARRSCRP